MKKLSSISAYEGVFNGAQANYNNKNNKNNNKMDEDYNYKEIFKGNNCSIPILDLSALDGVSINAKKKNKKNIDYSIIFGGVNTDFGDSYDEIFAKRTPSKTASCSDGSSPPRSQKEEEYEHGTPKQYNAFYHRASQGSKDGGNGTTHVAQIRAVPGFTCFIDENIQRTEGGNFGPLPKEKMRPTRKVSAELNKKQTTVGTQNSNIQSSLDKFHSVARNVVADGASVKTHSFKLPSPTRPPASSASETKRSGKLHFKVSESAASKMGLGDFSPSSSDEELDINSAASASAAALRKAVREAEASIRLAKEIMERKRNGFEKFPKPAKRGLEVKKRSVEKARVQAIRTENVSPNSKEIEDVKIANESVRITNGAKSNSHDDGHTYITKLERKKVRGGGNLAPSFIQSGGNGNIENILGKGKEEKPEASADAKSPQQFPELLVTEHLKLATSESEHTNGSNSRPFLQNTSGIICEEKLETSADIKAPEPVKTGNQGSGILEMVQTSGFNIMSAVHNLFGKVTESMLEPSCDSKEIGQCTKRAKENQRTGHANGNNIMPSVDNVYEKANEDKLEQSADSKSMGKFPELKRAEIQSNANLELEEANGNITIPSFHVVFGKEDKEDKDKLELSFESKTMAQYPESMGAENQRNANLELEEANGNSTMPSFHKVFGKEDMDMLELSFESKTMGQFPESMGAENQRNANLELEEANGSSTMPSFHNVFGKEDKEKLELSVESKTMGQFLEFMGAENQGNANLELGYINGNITMPSPHNVFGKENEDKLELSTESEALGQFPEMTRAEDQRDSNLELGCTNGNITMPSPHNVFGKENEDKLELFTESKASRQLPELVRAENPRNENLELGLTEGNSSIPSLHDVLGKENEDRLELSTESNKALELEKTDYQRTTTLELEQTSGSNIKPSVQNFSEKVNEEKLETSAEPKALGQIPELGKIDQRTTVSELEHKSGSDISTAIHNVPTTVNEEKLGPSADFVAPVQYPELVKTDNHKTATLELGHKNGSNMMQPAHTSDREEMEKQTDEGTFEFSERHNKETHRKRKQWKDFEGKPSDIKIAVDGGQFVHDTTAQQVHGQEEKILETLEEHSKEIHRKRRQWKDVQVKPCDIKIAGDGEKYVHGEEMREKATDVLDKKGVEDKRKSSIEESYEGEVVMSQESEKNDAPESSNAKSYHSEELDKAQKLVENEGIKEHYKGVQEEKESLKHMCKQDEIMEKHQDSKQWRDYEVASNIESNINAQNDDSNGEMINHNGANDAWKEDGSEHVDDCQVANRHKADDTDVSSEGSERMSDASQSSFDFKEDFDFEEEEGETSEIFQSCDFSIDENGSVEMTYAQGRTRTSMTNQSLEEPTEHEVTMTKATNSLLVNNIPELVNANDENSGAKQIELDGHCSELANNISTGTKAFIQMQVNNVFGLETSILEKRVEMESPIEVPNLFKAEDKTRGVYEQEWVTMRNRKEVAEEKIRGTGEVDEQTTTESRQKEVKVEKEQLERNDETSKREREREKNRMVVERAIREARERAFAEARERAERAAVEKATAEARERVMAEARQKFEKANAGAKSSTEKVSAKSKLRSERAAVERAHAEARERALEKALSQNSNISSKLDANNGESAERRNARLERTQKTMERAAKALAEKNMRDLRAEREQAERHRLAETLDAEIKRWSSGKTGNLRALLSTLQYILGPDSGWQPISLPEIVTTGAVKKAYRKATLHVHPDKLQQRGATIQQKYICEKVFDLLKAAWNRFSSEER